MFKSFPWQDMCKFFAGGFFTVAAVSLYLDLAHVWVPVLGTGLSESPRHSAMRAGIHAVLFLIFFYIGFIHTGSDDSADQDEGGEPQEFPAE